MSFLPKNWLVIGILLILAGCATTPAPLQGNFASITQQQAQQENHQGQRVRWGGEVIKTTPGKTETCFEILGHRLGDTGRPQTGDDNQGRFIGCAKGFYEPDVYAKGREVTVVGTLGTPVTQKIGEFDYRYPRVLIEQLYLWPKPPKTYPVPPGYYSPFYDPFYDPFWPGPFYRRWPYY